MIEETIRQRHPDTVQFETSSVRTMPDGDFLVYAYEILPGDAPDPYRLGITEIKLSDRFPYEWKIVSNSVVGSSTESMPGMLFEFGLSQTGENTQAMATTIFGYVLSKKVTAIEALQEDGEVVREDVKEPFVLIRSKTGRTFCQIRVLGSEEVVLKEIPLEEAVCDRASPGS